MIEFKKILLVLTLLLLCGCAPVRSEFSDLNSGITPTFYHLQMINLCIAEITSLVSSPETMEDELRVLGAAIIDAPTNLVYNVIIAIENTTNLRIHEKYVSGNGDFLGEDSNLIVEPHDPLCFVSKAPDRDKISGVYWPKKGLIPEKTEIGRLNAVEYESIVLERITTPLSYHFIYVRQRTNQNWTLKKFHMRPLYNEQW